MSCGVSAGELDRMVTLQKPDAGTDEYGQPLGTYADVAQVWAGYKPATVREYIASRAAEAAVDAVFKIRWRTDIGATWRIAYDGKIFDVLSVMEIGLRDGLQILARARLA